MGRTVCVASVAVLLCCCAGANQTGARPFRTLSTESVTLWVTSADETLPLFLGDGKPYLVGEQGKQYEIGLTNRASTSVEVVVAVDGWDVISVEKADYRTHRGYVLLPGETVTLRGFRQNLSQVRAFTFGGDYAGGPKAARGYRSGVIGLAVFAEKKSLPRASAALPHWGEQQGDGGHWETTRGIHLNSEADFVSFQRQTAQHPEELLVVFYDESSRLQARGIAVPKPDWDDGEQGTPDPFPGVSER